MKELNLVSSKARIRIQVFSFLGFVYPINFRDICYYRVNTIIPLSPPDKYKTPRQRNGNIIKLTQIANEKTRGSVVFQVNMFWNQINISASVFIEKLFLNKFTILSIT